MNIDIIYILALGGIVVSGAIAMKVLYRRSVVSNIGALLIVYSIYASGVTYVFAKLGTVHLYWIAPSALIFIILLLYVVNIILKKPLSRLVKGFDRMAEGELNIELKEPKQNNELKSLYAAVSRLTEFLGNKHGIIEKIASGHGDFTVQVDLASERDEFGKSIDRMLESLNDVLGQVNNASVQVDVGSAQLADTSQSLSQGTTEQASSLEEISASITEISEQAKQNAEKSQNAIDIAGTAGKSVSDGNEIVTAIIAAMDKIRESSEEISKIVKIIEDISFQINLLALNANVEAARAGKYGKGFAVVAEEVRNLANNSSNNVSDITHIVDDSKASITHGNELVGNMSAQFAEILSGIDQVTSLVNEIAIASTEQSGGLDQIAGGVAQIDSVTQANTANAEESAAAAEELAAQAQTLSNVVSGFKLNDRRQEDSRRKEEPEDSPIAARAITAV